MLISTPTYHSPPSADIVSVRQAAVKANAEFRSKCHYFAKIPRITKLRSVAGSAQHRKSVMSNSLWCSNVLLLESRKCIRNYIAVINMLIRGTGLLGKANGAQNFSGARTALSVITSPQVLKLSQMCGWLCHMRPRTILICARYVISCEKRRIVPAPAVAT